MPYSMKLSGGSDRALVAGSDAQAWDEADRLLLRIAFGRGLHQPIEADLYRGPRLLGTITISAPGFGAYSRGMQ